MNRIFKTVWNAVRRCLVVVNEATKSTAQARLSGSVKTALSGLILLSLASPLMAADRTVTGSSTINSSLSYGTLTVKGGNGDVGTYIKGHDLRDALEDAAKASSSYLYITENGDLTVNNLKTASGRITGSLLVYDGEGGMTHEESSSRSTSASIVNNGGKVNATNVEATYTQNSGISNFGTVTGSLTINGGILNINKDWKKASGTVLGEMNLTDGATLTLSDDLTTITNNIFANVEDGSPDALKTVGIQAKQPETIRSTKTEFFLKYVPGEIRQELIGHADFSDGKVIITNAKLTTTQRDDLTNLFKKTFGNKTQIVFEGNISGTSKNDILNTTKVNELYEKAGLQDVIYVDRALEGENTDVVIGNDGVKNSTGFTSINQAKSVTVKDGKNLVLIGNKEKMDLTGGKAINVQGNTSKLILGTLGLSSGSQYSGVLTGATLTDGADLDIVNGAYTISSISTTGTTKSDIYIGSAGQLIANSLNLSANGNLVNEGKSTLKETTIAQSGQLVNNGTLNFTGTNKINTNVSGNGIVNVQSGSFFANQFNSGSINILNGSTTLNHLNENAQHSITGGELHTGVKEIYDSLGTMEADDVHIIGLNAKAPENVRTSLTEVFKKYVPGFVKEDLDQYASFEGGKVVVNGDGLTTTQRDDLTKAFKETFFIRFPKAFLKLSALCFWA